MTEIKKIGILTSGGDCAGLNAVVMSVVNSANKYGWEVYGIHNGTDGLTEAPLSYELLTTRNFSDTPWPRLAGSYLGSLNKGVKMESQAEISKRFGNGVRELGLDAVVVVGGDGSMNIVSNYCKNAGVKMVGIPKTIDKIGYIRITEFATDTSKDFEKAYIEIKGNDIYVVDYYYGIKKEKHFLVSDITAAEILSGRSFKVKGWRIQQFSYIVFKNSKKYMFKIICLPETKELFKKYL